MIYCFKVCLVQNARVLFCIKQKCVKSGIKIVFHHCSKIEIQLNTYLAYSSILQAYCFEPSRYSFFSKYCNISQHIMLSTISFVLNTLNLKVIATRIICRARYNMRYNLCLLKICNNFSRLTIHKLQEEGIQSSRKRVRVYICIKKDLRSCYFMYILFLQLPLRQRTLKYELCILSLRCNSG